MNGTRKSVAILYRLDAYRLVRGQLRFECSKVVGSYCCNKLQRANAQLRNDRLCYYMMRFLD